MNDDERRAAEVGLREIPNVGPATARDLIVLGILSRADAAGKNPDALYETLCALDGVRHDPCVRDVFAAVVAYADGEPAHPWWVYSRRRKERERGKRTRDSGALRVGMRHSNREQ